MAENILKKSAPYSINIPAIMPVRWRIPMLGKEKKNRIKDIPII